MNRTEDRVKRLKELRDKGLIDQVEFDTQLERITQGVQHLQKHRRILQVRYDVGKFALAAHGLDYVPEMFYLGFVRPEAVFACLVYILAESR